MSEIVERSDVRRLEQAVRHRWQLPEQLYLALPNQMMKLLVNGTPREQIAAARVLALLHQANEEATPRVAMVAHRHQHEIMPVTTGNINERRSELLARPDSISRNA